jgi:hypothetical protein
LQVEIAGQGFDRDPGGTPMTTGELAGLIGLPRHSVPGFSVAEMPRLETNLSSGEGARIAEVMHLASANGVVCSLSGEKLVKHILVTGITGSGKTHTVQTLLARAGLPFMVLELANYSGGAEHLLVIEEAHRFLRREGASRLGEMDANPREHAIEFFANMLSELRATGQGVIIAEQIPSKIIPDVIKNTSTKIVHRLVAVDDQRAISTTLGLDEQDSRYLNELVTGEALLFKEGMGRAAKLRVDAGDRVIRLDDGKLRELMAAECAALSESRYGDLLGRDSRLWGQLALRLLVTLMATDAGFGLVLDRVLVDVPVSYRRQEGFTVLVRRLLQVRINALLAHGVFAIDSAGPKACVEIYRMTVNLFGLPGGQEAVLDRWRDAITRAWGIPVRQQGVAQRVAGLLLRFVGAHPQAVRDQAALERAVDQWVKLDAPAFKAQVVQLVLAQTGAGR